MRSFCSSAQFYSFHPEPVLGYNRFHDGGYLHEGHRHEATFIKMRNAMMNVHGSLRGALERGYQLSYGSMRRLAGSLYDRLAQE